MIAHDEEEPKTIKNAVCGLNVKEWFEAMEKK